jgi:hypothetical protein
MSRLASSFLVVAATAMLVGCGSSSNGGTGGSGSGGAPGTGGAVTGTGGSITGTGGAVTGTGGATKGTGGAVTGTGGSTVGAGGSTGPSGLDLVPRDNTVAGWTIDPDNDKTAGKVAATATDELSTTALIDGAAADFFAAPYSPTLFAWQNYVNASISSAKVAKLVLYILQLPSADQASGLYTSLLKASLYKGKDWKTMSPVIGAGSRIADTGDNWWVNFYKGSYYVEVSIDPSYDPAPPYTAGFQPTKDAAVAFATAIAAKIN